MIELRKIRHVLGIVEHGSFAAAAQALNVSQSALTKTVQSVEGRLGFRLLDRTQHGVVPTAEGEWFLVRGARLLADAEQISSDSFSVRQLRKGRLRIGAAPAAFDWLWLSAVPAFAGRYPGIKLELLEEPAVAVGRLLLMGSLDLALGVLGSLADERELEVTKIAEYPIEIYVRRGHPLDAEARPAPEALLRFPMVGPVPAEPYESTIKQLQARYDTPFELPHFVVDSFQLMTRLVEHTDAFSLVIQQRARTASFAARFRCWPADPLFPALPIWLARRRDSLLSIAAAEFVRVCLQDAAGATRKPPGS